MASCGSLSARGFARPLSHLLTAEGFTPTAFATSSCVGMAPRSLRSFMTFMHLPPSGKLLVVIVFALYSHYTTDTPVCQLFFTKI
nr:MAG TPA: hypothetical protein [Caudoviricetes sp.]